jgi:hypothetical protein
MQSNEQDESHDNELARVAAGAWERLRPQLGTIAAVVGLAVAGLVGWSLVSSQRDAELAQGWDECIDAVQQRDMARLGDVADRYRGTSAAAWSRVLLADAALDEGCALLSSDRKAGLERLNAAAELYASVNADRPRGLAAERAIFGLAKTNESLGKLADARLGYETLSSEYPAGPLRGLAESRARDVGSEAAARWYDWFEKRDATPAPTTEPATGSAAAEPAGAGDAGSAPAGGK